MVAEALVKAPHESQFDGDNDWGARSHKLRDEGHVEIVHLVVQRLEPLRGTGHVPSVGVRRHPPHLARHLTHALDVASQAGWHLGREIARSPSSHVLGEITTSFQLGQHSKHGE